MTQNQPLAPGGEIRYTVKMPDDTMRRIRLCAPSNSFQDYRVTLESGPEFTEPQPVQSWSAPTEFIARQIAIVQARLLHEAVNAALAPATSDTLRPDFAERDRATGKPADTSPWKLTDAEASALVVAWLTPDGTISRGKGVGKTPRPVLASLVRKGLMTPVTDSEYPWKGWTGGRLTDLGFQVAARVY